MSGEERVKTASGVGMVLRSCGGVRIIVLLNEIVVGMSLMGVWGLFKLDLLIELIGVPFKRYCLKELIFSSYL